MAQKFNPLSGNFDLVLDKASEIINVPSGNLAAVNVQTALNELQGDINTINADIVDDVEGPASSTDNGFAKFDGVTGKLLKSSAATIVNADVNASAAIAYSKLNLATSIVNADVNASAAIAYSKLNLATSIINADVNASAAIALSKLAATTASRALISDASGFVSAATTTSTEIGYVNGVTSAIQTQINTKQATITGGATTITSSNLTASRALASDASGKVAVSATTSAELAFVSGVTSAIQTQINTKQAIKITIVAVTTNVTLTNDATHFVTTTSARSLTMPASPGTGSTITVKDITGSADVNNITIVRAASETIEGVSGSYVIDAARVGIQFVADASNNWWIV